VHLSSIQRQNMEDIAKRQLKQRRRGVVAKWKPSLLNLRN
jgi:hypothetical protein